MVGAENKSLELELFLHPVFFNVYFIPEIKIWSCMEK